MLAVDREWRAVHIHGLDHGALACEAPHSLHRQVEARDVAAGPSAERFAQGRLVHLMLLRRRDAITPAATRQVAFAMAAKPHSTCADPTSVCVSHTVYYSGTAVNNNLHLAVRWRDRIGYADDSKASQLNAVAIPTVQLSRESTPLLKAYHRPTGLTPGWPGTQLQSQSRIMRWCSSTKARSAPQQLDNSC
jgi:hypothetical protein